MDEGLDNNGIDMDSGVPTLSHIVKGSIVLTPTNFIGRVKWVQSPASALSDGNTKVSVEYLEYRGGYNVYNLEQLTLLCDGADKPKFDDITMAQVKREREVYEEELRMIEAFPRTKVKSARKESESERIARLLIEKLSSEDLEKLLEDL